MKVEERKVSVEEMNQAKKRVKYSIYKSKDGF